MMTERNLRMEMLLQDLLETVENQKPVDLTAVVQAVQGLNGGASAQEIAEALAKYLAPADYANNQLAVALNDIKEQLSKLPRTLREVGGGRTIVAGPNIPNDMTRQLGKVNVENFPATQDVNVTNTDVRVTNTTAQEIGTGKFNIYGSGKISLAVAGNFRAILRNPSTSGKTIKLHRISAFGTSTGWASILINPTTGLPITAARPSLNAIVGGGVAGIAEVKADADTTTPLGGGTDTGIVLGIAGGQRTELNLPPLIIAPGVALGFNVPFAGAADVTLAVYTTEV